MREWESLKTLSATAKGPYRVVGTWLKIYNYVPYMLEVISSINPTDTIW